MKSRLRKFYVITAVLWLNTTLIFILLNGAAWLYNRSNDPYDRVLARIYKTFADNPEIVDNVFAHLEPDQLDRLLVEMVRRPFVYAPFTEYREGSIAGQFVNIAENGFRQIENQGSWPPQSQYINIFLFGGSTTFGYKVADSETIPSYLQQIIAEEAGSEREVRVYNLGQSGYYIQRERILFAQLLAKGIVPDIVVFIDGLNEFQYPADETVFTNRLREAMNGRSAGWIEAFPLVKPAVNLLPHWWTPGPTAGSSDDLTADQIAQRYLRNKSMIEAVAGLYGVSPYFVWQPVPHYNYEPQFPWIINDEAFRSSDLMDQPGHALYVNMRRLYEQDSLGDNFIWLADSHENQGEWLYADPTHYSRIFSRVIAESIHQALQAQNYLSIPD